MGNKPNELKQRRSSNFSKASIQSSKSVLSDLPPYTASELTRLRELFSKLDVKGASSIEIDKLDEVLILKESPFYPRIKQLAQDQISQSNNSRLKFEMFADLLSVFHIATSIEDKYKYLFRVYDWDKDYKLNAKDIAQTLNLMLNKPNSKTNVYTEADLKALAEEFVEAYGQKGFIKVEAFREAVNEDEVRFLMTVFF